MTERSGETLSPPPVLIRPGWLIDGVADQPRSGYEVRVEGGVITGVGPVPDAAHTPQGAARVIELPGATLLPGLIDCHVHYLLDSEIETGNSVLLAKGAVPERQVLVGARNARRALEAGVTTARSAGAPGDLDVALAEGIRRGDVTGPRLLASGRAVTITGGHGAPFGITADSPAEMVKAVRVLVDAGAEVIKAVASEAAMLVNDRAGVPEMTMEQLSAIVAEAARLHRLVLAHAQDSQSVAAAARAGVASVEHAFLADEEALTALAESGAALTPTLVVTDVYRALSGLSAAQQQRQRVLEAAHRASCEMAIGMGIPIVTGTDCGLRGVHPGMLWREIALLVDHGMAPMEAIKAATSRAARVLGVDASVGSIAVGKQADLVAVQGDPLGDPSVLARPSMVMRGGEMVIDRTGPAEGADARALVLDTPDIADHDTSDN